MSRAFVCPLGHVTPIRPGERPREVIGCPEKVGAHTRCGAKARLREAA